MAPLVMANKPGTYMRQNLFWSSDIFVIHTRGGADSEIWEQMDVLSHGDLPHWIP